MAPRQPQHAPQMVFVPAIVYNIGLDVPLMAEALVAEHASRSSEDGEPPDLVSSSSETDDDALPHLGVPVMAETRVVDQALCSSDDGEAPDLVSSSSDDEDYDDLPGLVDLEEGCRQLELATWARVGVFRGRDGTFTVLDGNHRIEALQASYDQLRVTYTFPSASAPAADA
jgi:hypothetical protein